MELSAGISLRIFLYLSFQVLLISSVDFARGHDKDELALLAFKATIEDPLNVLSSWNASQHFCKWQGVTCGRRHRRVTKLVLKSCKLKGPLSPHVGNLSFLRTLYLKNNSFSQAIPSQISNLFRLKALALSNNSFSGMIPTNISRCSNLQFVDLSANNLTGKVPQDMGLLSQLRGLNLIGNNLFGEIPASLGNLSSLMWIQLGNNRFCGRIPQSFGQLKSLVWMDLGNTSLTGIVPPSLYNLSSLQQLGIYETQVEGTLPFEFGNYFPNLDVLFLHSNYLSGSIPVTISNITKVRRLDMSYNHFKGDIPNLASLSKLQKFGISENNLGHGKNDDLKFLSSLVNCTDLDYLGIEGNKFGGSLPEYISNFSTKLTELSFGRNQMSGSIPIGIGNLVNLEVLALEKNQLTGNIPSSIGKLQNLYWVTLGRNKLVGSIPSSLGNLTSLNILNFPLNNIEGVLPVSLGQCKQLRSLGLSTNAISGDIPKELTSLSSLTTIDLSVNHFTGSIPKDMGKLINLGYLDISENKLVGEIPKSLGGCTNLQNLYLEGNSFQGTIPNSISSLRGLDEINLSRNNLSGKIPTYFEGFRFLKLLNLSFNDFEGEVPFEGVFKNSSGFSITGNKRACGGVLQLHLPRCPSKRYTKHERSPKLKLIISITTCGFGLILIVLLMSIHLSRKQKTTSTSGPSDIVSLLQLSYGDLVKATDDFSSTNLIGTGSFGSVYKGILNTDGTEVAVKVLNLQTSKASKSFVAECRALRNIRHRNLVKVLTACSSTDYQGNDFKALVYEFMANGSLEEWLHGERRLGLVQRFNIAIDVANALDYLHNRCGQIPVVHCDLKPSNILLDKDIAAHVGDFGLVRFLSDPSHPFSSNHTSSIGLRGSVGYAAPEYGMGSELSTCGDVYSYGILLLEMFSGKRPTDGMFRDDSDLHNFALMVLPEHVEEFLDPGIFQTEDGAGEVSILYNNEIQNQVARQCLISIVEIGVACSAKLPGDRMSIDNVVSRLSHIKDMLLKTRLTII